MTTFEPLRVDFFLSSPSVVRGFPAHFDALLAYAMVEDKIESLVGEETSVSLPIRGLSEDLLSEVLEKETRGTEAVWKASALCPIDAGPSHVRFWRRMTDIFEIAGLCSKGIIETKRKLETGSGWKISTASGPYRNYIKAYMVREIPRMSAWCIGDAERIEEILTYRVPYLGGRTRLGYGRVEKVTVTPDPDAFEKWKFRTLPWPEKDYVPVQMSCRPPYWDAFNRRMAYVPVDLV